MKKFTFLILLSILTSYAVSAEQARPGPHNKMGLSQMSEEEKKDTFFYKLFNEELDLTGSSSDDDNDKILGQIEKLADLKERAIITEKEFQEKKSILLEKIK